MACELESYSMVLVFVLTLGTFEILTWAQVFLFEELLVANSNECQFRRFCWSEQVLSKVWCIVFLSLSTQLFIRLFHLQVVWYTNQAHQLMTYFKSNFPRDLSEPNWTRTPYFSTHYSAQKFVCLGCLFLISKSLYCFPFAIYGY